MRCHAAARLLPPFAADADASQRRECRRPDAARHASFESKAFSPSTPLSALISRVMFASRCAFSLSFHAVRLNTKPDAARARVQTLLLFEAMARLFLPNAMARSIHVFDSDNPADVSPLRAARCRHHATLLPRQSSLIFSP